MKWLSDGNIDPELLKEIFGSGEISLTYEEVEQAIAPYEDVVSIISFPDVGVALLTGIPHIQIGRGWFEAEGRDCEGCSSYPICSVEHGANGDSITIPLLEYNVCSSCDCSGYVPVTADEMCQILIFAKNTEPEPRIAEAPVISSGDTVDLVKDFYVKADVFEPGWEKLLTERNKGHVKAKTEIRKGCYALLFDSDINPAYLQFILSHHFTLHGA